MKTKSVIIIGLFTTLITSTMFAGKEESGDVNAILMYLLVFFIPICIVSIGDGLYLMLLDKIRDRFSKIILSLIPVALLCLLSLTTGINLSFFDADIAFLGKTGAIGIGITNAIWVVYILQRKVEI